MLFSPTLSLRINTVFFFSFFPSLVAQFYAKMGFSMDYQMTVTAHMHTLVKFCHSPVTSDLRNAPAKEHIIFNV